MNEQLLLSILSSSFVAGIAGAYVGHWLTFRREKKNRLQQQRIEYLINAYRAFAKGSSSPRLWDVAEDLEQAVADIQILGSPELIDLVQEFLKQFYNEKSTSVEGIVRAIRKDLRSELGEKPVSGEILRLRIERPPKEHR
jgi:hypothetical protein